MNKFIRLICLPFLLLFMMAATNINLSAQDKKVGYLEVKGRISKDRRPLDGAQVAISKNGKWIDNISTAGGGKFKINLDMNSEYLLTFSSPGCYNKIISISSLINEKDLSYVWTYSFSVDLIAEIPGFKNPEVFTRPVAKVVYRGDEQAFNYDEKYTSAAQTEINKLLSDAMARQNVDRDKRQKDSLAALKADAENQARIDAAARLLKHKNDSVASLRAKQQSESDRLKQLADQKAKMRADSLARVQAAMFSKHKADSLAKADADAKLKLAALRAKQKADSLAKADTDAKNKSLFEKQRLADAKRRADSTAKADAENRIKLAALKTKQRADSITKAQADAKAKAIEKARLDELARAKHKADSSAKAFADAQKAIAEKAHLEAEKKRAQHLADSLVFAEAARRKAEEEARVKEEARLKVLQQHIADSVYLAKKHADEMAAVNKKKVATTEPDSYKEETITDDKKTVIKTTVVKGGFKTIYELNTYNWGGVFYFKDKESISKDTYDQELKEAKQ